MLHNKIRVFTYAASDRNNYGDLLFPLIVESYLRQRNFSGEILHAAIHKSNLTFIGGKATISHRSMEYLLRTDIPSHIVFAGGEIIGSTWFNLLRFIFPEFQWLHQNFFTGKLLRRLKIVELLGYALTHSSHPFLLSKAASATNTYSYSSVGAHAGGRALKQSGVIETLQNASWLSVRDNVSAKLMKQHGLTPFVVPDSAVIMSDLFNHKLDPTICGTLKPYIFVQFNKAKGPPNLEEFAAILHQIQTEYDYHIVLSPIGLALDHNDLDALNELHSILPEASLIIPKTIWETMSLIVNAEFYMGTSLHGMLTAISYERPFLGLAASTPKIRAYLDTWDLSFHCNSNYNQLSEDIRRTIFKGVNTELLREHKSLVYKSLNSQFRHILAPLTPTTLSSYD